MRGSEREGAWEGRWGSEPFLMTCLRGAQSEERGEKGQSEHKQQQYSAFSQRVGISLRPVIFVSGLFVVRLLSLALLLLLLCLGGWLVAVARACGCVALWFSALSRSPLWLAVRTGVLCLGGEGFFFLFERGRESVRREISVRYTRDTARTQTHT